MQTIAIVGAGFSGVAVAWNLLQQLPPQSRLLLISNEAVIGRGLAYGTPSPHHLLNVPAARMGIAADDETGFLRFLQQLGLPFQAGDFVPRNLYGAYLQRVLGEQRALASARQIVFEIIYDNVLALQAVSPATSAAIGRSGNPVQPALSLQLAKGASLHVHKVVLALGNFAPRPLAYEAEPGLQVQAQTHILQRPWDFSSLLSIPVHASVLLLGSGLTAVDVLLQLRHLGHSGKVTMLSRRGLLAQAHRAAGHAGVHKVPEEFVAGMLKLRSVRAMLAYFRQNLMPACPQHSAQAAASTLDWRDLLAALRPVSAELWQVLPESERGRFLRHLQALWDSHRHRMAAPVARQVQQEIQQQRLRVQAGRLKHLLYRAGQKACWQVSWQARAQLHSQIQAFDYVINCTGPVSALRSQPEGLLARLLQQGQICADVAELGLLVHSDYRVQAADEKSALPGLYYIGPLLKAQFWEATAVPELRWHAARLAQQICRDLAAPPD